MLRKVLFVFLRQTNHRLLAGTLLAMMTPGFIRAFCYARSDSLASTPHYLAGSLARDEPQAIYAADTHDSWNRIFYCLFTRTIQTRLTDGFPDGAPFTPVDVMGLPQLTASTRSFTRIESGDGAIEPIAPLYFPAQSAFQVFNEPRYSQLTSALTQALAEETKRSPLHRALMQSDAWAAYDILSRHTYFEGEEGKQQKQRQNLLLQLLARFIKKLALTSQEINSLPDNYAAAVQNHRLPDFLSANSDWIEIRWEPEREHDRAFHYRRATRIFIKPTTPQPAPQHDRQRFVETLRTERLNEKNLLASVALVVQNLLIDKGGAVVSAPLIYEVQLRHFRKNEMATMEVFELNRQLFLTNPQSGGLKAKRGPAYLATSGNDLSFAPPHYRPNGAKAPILAPLRSRCVSCHGDNLQVVLTLSRHSLRGVGVPPIRSLNAIKNERSRYVAKQKMAREDFKALLKQWQEPEERADVKPKSG